MNKKKIDLETVKNMIASDPENKGQKRFKEFAKKLCKRLLQTQSALETAIIAAAICCLALALIYEDDDFYNIAVKLYRNGRKRKKKADKKKKHNQKE